LPEKERLVALVADVYQYNGEYLEEAVGMIDEIYVVTEINRKPCLTKVQFSAIMNLTAASLFQMKSGNNNCFPVRRNRGQFG